MTARAYSFFVTKTVNEDERTITGMASTPETDRVGDIVEPLGAQFANPLPLLWMHQRDLPVGTVVFGKPTKDGIPFTAKLPSIPEPAQLKARIDEAWQSIKAGLVRAVSIGFRPIEYAINEDTGGYTFLKTDIFELSLVTVPANASATIATIKSYDAEALAALGHKEAKMSSVKTQPGASGRPITVKLSPKEGPQKMKIQEQVKAFQAERAAKAAQMEEIMKASADKGETLDEAQAEAFATLEAELKEIDKQLARLDSLETVLAGSARKVEVASEAQAKATRTGVVAVSVAKTYEPGVPFARMAKCLGIAEKAHISPVAIAEERCKDDPRIAKVLKTAIAAATTSETTWAAPLVGDETSVYADFVEYLRPQTILGKFGANGIPSLRRVPFRVALVGQTSGGAGYWVGEGNAKPLTKFDFSRTTLEPLKVANIAVVTEEVLRDSSPSADLIVRDSLAAALKARLDTDFVAPTKAASAGVSPASITYGVAATTSSGNTADAVRADIRALLASFIAANNAPSTGVFIMPALVALSLSLMRNSLGQSEFPGITMNGGMLEGFPVITSEYMPTDSAGSYVAFVNAQDIYLGDDGGIRVDLSREASLEMSDSPSGDSDTPTAAQLVSLFQTDSVAFRAERTINWKKRRTSAVALLDGVNWGVSA